MKHLKKKKKHMPLWAALLLDVVLAGLILLCFAFFHHVLPAMQSKWAAQQTRPVETDPRETEPQKTEPSQETVPAQTEAVTEATEPDNRTQWQKKFSEHFTEEVVVTENSYTSPEISITIDTVVTGEGSSRITYYVADIYVASLDNFGCYTANNTIQYFGTQDAREMVSQANAVLAISGDFITYQKSGFLLRNGEIYAADHNLNSICVLFPDGTMETHVGGTYQIQQILDRSPLQVWSFGPVLLDENGNTREHYEVSTAVSFPNPRSAIGYYEPGHYCFVVVDGRQEGHSAGMTIPQLAQVFQDLGCTAAYNLDGGGSAVMYFGPDAYSRQSNGGRELGDILFITESGYAGGKEEG